MKREINGERGFTRVDALVTITVITMIITTSLAAIVPAMNKAREAAMRARCANQMRQIGAAIAMYADVYDNWLPFYGGYDPNFTNLDPPLYRYRCNMGGASTCPRDEEHPYAAFRANELWCENADTTKPWPMKLGCLYRAGIITDASVFYCPANQDPFYQYESYANPLPWGSLPQEFNTGVPCSQWVRTGYSYFPVDGTIPERNFEYSLSALLAPRYTARRYDKLDPNIPYLADVLWFRKTMSHQTESGGYSVNALFKDGHVVYCKDRRFFYDVPDSADPRERLWSQWDPDDPFFTGKVNFNFFYYNFLKKIQP
jgi:Tfp pilus assembly protein PilV